MPTEEINVEELVRSIEETGEQPVIETTEPQAEEPAFKFKDDTDLLQHELSYTANGKEVKENIETILKRASQGYNYAQSIAQLKAEQEAFAKSKDETTALHEKWSKFENYAKENPEWYQHWENAYENREQTATTDREDPNSDLLAKVREEFKPVLEHVEKQKSEIEQARIDAEDAELEKAMKDVKARYANVDFSKTDPETGKSLEHQVLEYGANYNIPDFETAFKAFYHDNLVDMKIQQSKEDWIKEQQAKKREGFVSESSGPITTKDGAIDHTKYNMDQLTQLALREVSNS